MPTCATRPTTRRRILGAVCARLCFTLSLAAAGLHDGVALICVRPLLTCIRNMAEWCEQSDWDGGATGGASGGGYDSDDMYAVMQAHVPVDPTPGAELVADDGAIAGVHVRQDAEAPNKQSVRRAGVPAAAWEPPRPAPPFFARACRACGLAAWHTCTCAWWARS